MFVTIYKAALQSKIPKCTLYYQAKMVPRPVYFRKIKGGGLMIELDDPMWKAYVEDFRVRKGFKKLDNEQLKKLVNATVEVIKEVYAPSEERLQQLLLKINKTYQSYE